MKVISRFINIDLLFSDQGQRVRTVYKASCLAETEISQLGLACFYSERGIECLDLYLKGVFYADMSVGKIQFKN